jgi:hypothetical protein
MVFYEQLELFDVRPYMTEQPIHTEQSVTVGIKEQQFNEVPLYVEYKQLELDLFSQSSNLIEIESMKLAA